jgi:hypothetical protein
MNFFQQLQEFQTQANQIEDLRLRSEAWIYCNFTSQLPSKRDFTQVNRVPSQPSVCGRLAIKKNGRHR